MREVISTLVAYHVTSNRKLWDHILEYLTDEQFTQETGFSHGSVRNQVVHLAATDRYWLYDIQSKPVTGLEPQNFPTRDSFTDTWAGIGDALMDYVQSLSDAELVVVPDGLMYSRWQALAHVVNHGTDHRAQILSTLHGLSLPTYDQEFPNYLRAVRQVSVEDMLALVHYWHGQTQKALEQVSGERFVEPLSGEWTVKDLLSQLAWYDREMAQTLQERQLPETEIWGLSRQERDSQIVSGSRNQSWEKVQANWNVAHRSLIKAIERLDIQDLNDPTRIRGIPPGVKLWEVLERNTWSKYLAFVESLWGLLGIAEP